MAEKRKRPAGKRLYGKQRSKRRTSDGLSLLQRLPFFKNRIGRVLAVIASLVLLATGNWFAHLPSERRAEFGALEAPLEMLGSVTADLTDSFGLTGRDVAVPYLKEPEKGPLPFGLPTVADRRKAPSDIRVLKRQGYWVGFSPSLGYPVWTAYAVPVGKVLEYPPERPPFYQDRELPGSPAPDDYLGSGYDRGHMAPNYVIATRYGRSAQKETFLMTNIAPQRPDLNRGPWKDLEKIVADDFSEIGDRLWVIVCAVPDRKAGRLKKGRVSIPAGFAMIISSVHDRKLRTLGLYMPQTVTDSRAIRYYFSSVRELEAMSGLNFFGDLSREQQDALEVPEANRFWPKWNFFFRERVK